MNEIIMQGTVWGSLFCNVSIDKLGKKAYAMPDILYNYNGVQIPQLGMVDDISAVTNVENTQCMNQIVNTFIENKKLRLPKKKCFRIHIGKGQSNCPQMKANEDITQKV